MDREEIPDDLKRFILAGVHSVPYLEAMLLLRSESGRAWDARQVARRLYLSEKAAGKLLSELHAAQVVQVVVGAMEQEPASYRYQPASEDQRRLIDRLADVYSRNLIGVTNVIHSAVRMRTKQVADAFKWRKDS